MKVRVLKEFRDRDNFALVYGVDSIIDLDAERIKGLVALGLVEEIRENTKKTKTAKK